MARKDISGLWENGIYHCFDQKNDYELIIDPKGEGWKGVYFEFPFTAERYRSKRTGNPVMRVTARRIDEYGCFFGRQVTLDPNLAYLEIGPGLGSFTPTLASIGKRKDLPTAIDLCDYDSIKRLLNFALKRKDLQREEKSRLVNLMENCEVITDSSKVNLIKEPLLVATQKFELTEKFDVVVDNVAAGHYTQGDLGLATIAAIRKMLKPEGRLYTDDKMLKDLFNYY